MALHVVNEVGIPGRQEREKRHFTERRGTFLDENRGRKFIDHGFGEQPDWTPHGAHIDIKYSDKGQPDWVSRVRHIPEMSQTPKDREEFSLPKLRCFPERYAVSGPKQTTTYKGKRCKFVDTNAPDSGPIYMTNRTSSQEISHFMLFGNKRKFSTCWQRRGDIPYAALGDKSYQVPEYSPNFHCKGSTRPVVRFGGSEKVKPDTFIPLQHIVVDHSDNYRCRERRRRIQEDADQVSSLEQWTPAPVLLPPTVWEDGRRLINTTGT